MEMFKRQSNETSDQRVPDTCHRVCNHAAVEAGPEPRDWTICVIDAPLQVNAAHCLDCIVTAINLGKSFTYTQSDAEILSTFRVWRDFCDDWNDDSGHLTKAVDDMSLIIGDSDSVVVLPSCPAAPQSTQTWKVPFSTSCMGTHTPSSFVVPASTSSQVVGTGAEPTATATSTSAATSDVGTAATSSETATGAASLSAAGFAPAQLLLFLWVLYIGLSLPVEAAVFVSVYRGV